MLSRHQPAVESRVTAECPAQPTLSHRALTLCTHTTLTHVHSHPCAHTRAHHTQVSPPTHEPGHVSLPTRGPSHDTGGSTRPRGLPCTPAATRTGTHARRPPPRARAATGAGFGSFRRQALRGSCGDGAGRLPAPRWAPAMTLASAGGGATPAPPTLAGAPRPDGGGNGRARAARGADRGLGRHLRADGGLAGACRPPSASSSPGGVSSAVPQA